MDKKVSCETSLTLAKMQLELPVLKESMTVEMVKMIWTQLRNPLFDISLEALVWHGMPETWRRL